MNISDWVGAAGAMGAVATAAVAVFAIHYARKDSRESAEAAEKSLKETKRQVGISQRIVDVADKTFGSSCRPIIVSDAISDPPFTYLQKAVDERNSWSRGDFASYIQYPVRNIGVGPAMIASVKMTIVTGEIDRSIETYDAHSSIAAMAPSEIGLMMLLAPTINVAGVRLINALERGERLTIEISYTDIGTKRRYLTRFVLNPRTHMVLERHPPETTRDFSVHTTQIYECDDQGNVKEPAIASNKLPDSTGPQPD